MGGSNHDAVAVEMKAAKKEDDQMSEGARTFSLSTK